MTHPLSRHVFPVSQRPHPRSYTAYTCASFPRHPESHARFVFFVDVASKIGLPVECNMNPNVEVIELGQ